MRQTGHAECTLIYSAKVNSESEKVGQGNNMKRQRMQLTNEANKNYMENKIYIPDDNVCLLTKCKFM